MTMTSEEAFLDQLIAHPDDDLTRLVYADWLDEQGDPRGIYLRTEVELASLVGDDEQQVRLERRLLSQRLHLDPTWVGQVGKGYDVVLSRRPPDRFAVRDVLDSIPDLGPGRFHDRPDGCPLLEGVSRARAEHVRATCRRWDRKASVRPSTTRRNLFGHLTNVTGFVVWVRGCRSAVADLGSVIGQRTRLGHREIAWLVARLPVPLGWFATKAEAAGVAVQEARRITDHEILPALGGGAIPEPPTYAGCDLLLESFASHVRPDVLLAIHQATDQSLVQVRQRVTRLPLTILHDAPWEHVEAARRRFPPESRLMIRPSGAGK